MTQQYPQQPPPPIPGPPRGFEPHKKAKKPFVRRTWVLASASVLTILVVIGVLSGGDKTAPTSGSTKTTAAPRATAKPTPTLPTGKISTAVPSPKASAPAPTSTQADTQCTGSRNDPCTVKLGVAFTVGKHQVGKGWKLRDEPYLGTKLVGTVTNVSEEASTAIFTVKLLNGNRVVANFQCSSNELEPKQSEDVECYNNSDVGRSVRKGSYDKITAEADF